MVPHRFPLDKFPYSQHRDSRPFGPNLVPGQYVFVQSPDGTVWVLPESEGHLHPKVLGGYRPAIAAGGLLIGEGGSIVELDNFSGSFQFDREIFPSVREGLVRQGADVSKLVEVAFEYD